MRKQYGKRFQKKNEKEENGVLIDEKNENSTENAGETSRETEIKSTENKPGERQRDQEGQEQTGRQRDLEDRVAGHYYAF